MQITVNETGARTLADARPMRIDGQNVYVVVGGGTASLMIGGRIVAERKADDMNTTEAQAWAVEYRDGGTVVDEAAVAEATDPNAVYAAAVAAVRSGAADLITKAEASGAHGDGDYKFRSSLNGRWITFTSSDPRHPSHAAKGYREDAAILAAWTVTDEMGYSRYVDEGIGATDGHYTPMGRAAWKATVGT